jgi:hypothetical protein
LIESKSYSVKSRSAKIKNEFLTGVMLTDYDCGKNAFFPTVDPLNAKKCIGSVFSSIRPAGTLFVKGGANK